MALTAGTYVQAAVLGPTETGAVAAQFMDVAISKENLNSGVLYQRFNTKAFPKVGQTLSGTDADGKIFPKPAVVCADEPH